MSKDNHLDDLPQRGSTHDIEEKAIVAFQNAIAQENLFTIQTPDRKDYGTDFQIEAHARSAMTNTRIHVQLKGTTTDLNADGSVSVSVDRTNLNYLINQSHSIYICYHIPSECLFVKPAEEVYRQYERESEKWHTQKTITIKFKDTFDPTFQHQLNRLAIAEAKESRDMRCQWALASPEQIPKMINNATPAVHVPNDPERAYEILSNMYKAGQYAEISASFSQFEAILGHLPKYMMHAYMAEINLGIDGYQFDEERIRKAIPLLKEIQSKKSCEQGSLTYCIANAHLTLCEYENARIFYLQAIEQLSHTEASNEIAMSYKNLGATYKELNNFTDARTSYEMALKINPNLTEAIFALATCLYYDGEYQNALDLFDSIVWETDPLARSTSVQGWRIPILFKLNDPAGAFREINTLLSYVGKFEWIFPWCAKYVRQFEKESITTIQKSLTFWKRYLHKFPEDMMGRHEHLICIWHLHENDVPVKMNFEGFKQEALALIETGHFDTSFLWDRIGHWAQKDGRWDLAEQAYRKACENEPEMYGYCLGVALNYLDRYEEALPILLAQAEEHSPDELSWFAVASSHARLGNQKDAIFAYKRALNINPDYDLAWFNLGGTYFNVGKKELALETWEQAIAKFPDHELVAEAKKLISKLSN